MKERRIGIDMRMAGEGFGIGKYAIQLAKALIKRRNFEYVLFFDKSFGEEVFDEFKKLGIECHLLSARYYSFEEQLKLPIVLKRLKLDLVHFLNFNVPIFYKGKFVVTIHDLIHHHFPGTSSRTAIWRLGYRVAINLAAKRARKIIAVSEASRHDIILLLNADSSKVQVVHEAVDPFFVQALVSKADDVKSRLNITKPYVLWVGVWRRYKNLETLASAFNNLISKGKDLQLVLTGEEDKHHPEVAEKVRSMVSKNRLVAPGRVSNEDLAGLYTNALVFVNPSLSEGFGLTSIEAQSAGLPIIASDIPVMREVLRDSALYFDPKSTEHLTEKLNIILDDEMIRSKYKQMSLENAKTFSWDETARKTEEVYKQALKDIEY